MHPLNTRRVERYSYIHKVTPDLSETKSTVIDKGCSVERETYNELKSSQSPTEGTISDKGALKFWGVLRRSPGQVSFRGVLLELYEAHTARQMARCQDSLVTRIVDQPLKDVDSSSQQQVPSV